MAPNEVCPPTHKLEIRGMLTSDKVLTPAAKASVGQTPLRRSPTARVLIVDDEPAACKLLALLLSEADFECKTALSGAEALRLLEKDNRDAIVCDLNMPGMTGMGLLAEVRRRRPIPVIPGMLRSQTMASRLSFSRRRRASAPLSAVLHSKSASDNSKARSLQAAGSSSTMRTRAVGYCLDGTWPVESPATGVMTMGGMSIPRISSLWARQADCDWRHSRMEQFSIQWIAYKDRRIRRFSGSYVPFWFCPFGLERYVI